MTAASLRESNVFRTVLVAVGAGVVGAGVVGAVVVGAVVVGAVVVDTASNPAAPHYCPTPKSPLRHLRPPD